MGTTSRLGTGVACLVRELRAGFAAVPVPLFVVNTATRRRKLEFCRCVVLLRNADSSNLAS